MPGDRAIDRNNDTVHQAFFAAMKIEQSAAEQASTVTSVCARVLLDSVCSSCFVAPSLLLSGLIGWMDGLHRVLLSWPAMVRLQLRELLPSGHGGKAPKGAVLLAANLRCWPAI